MEALRSIKFPKNPLSWPKNPLSWVSSLAIFGIVVFVAGLWAFLYQNTFINARTTSAFAVINLAGRQRMLTQRMAKDAYAAQIDLDGRRSPLIPEKDFIASAQLYDGTLRIFQYGGEILDPKGEKLQIPPLTAEDVAPLVIRSAALWTPIMARVQQLDRDAASGTKLLSATNELILENKDLLHLSNDLTEKVTEQEKAAVEIAAWLRLRFFCICTGGILLTMLSFFIRAQESRKRLSQYAHDLEASFIEQQAIARELSEAQAGAHMIMRTINQGLFVIDERFRIQPQYSAELEKIFEAEDLAGRDVLLLLQNILNERTFRTVRDYMELWFDPKKKERVLLRANPLEEIECNFSNAVEGGFISKYLTFDFRRITSGQRITHLFIAVNDATERVILQRELRQNEHKREQQFELLMGMLHIDPATLDDFIKGADEQLTVINGALRTQNLPSSNGASEALRERVDTIARCIHNIKGNAAFIQFEYFRNLAESFENKLQGLRHRGRIGSDDFFSIVVAQSEIRASLEELQQLRQKFSLKATTTLQREADHSTEAPKEFPSLSSHASPLRLYTKPQVRDEFIVGLQGLAIATARKLGKEVRLDATGFQTLHLDETKRRALKDALIQLVRNSITHGIEAPEVRQKMGKPPRGTITLHAVSGDPSEFSFVFRDDGNGLDTERIIQRAIEQGIVSPEEAETYDQGSIVGLIFESGFSTAEAVTGESGRGVGMSIVKQRLVDECGGELSVLSEFGHYCEFRCTIPLTVFACA